MTWDEIWKAYFYELHANEANLWEEELKTKFNVKPQDGERFNLEIQAATRSLAEKQRTGALKHRPTLNYLISTIIKTRYDARVQREGGPFPSPEDDKCSLCGATGWMPYLVWTNLKTGKRTFGLQFNPHPGQSEHVEACPCLCSKGQKALCCYKEQLRPKVQSWSKLIRDHLVHGQQVA